MSDVENTLKRAHTKGCLAMGIVSGQLTKRTMKKREIGTAIKFLTESAQELHSLIGDPPAEQ